MSKKKFTEGLESLFSDSSDEFSKMDEAILSSPSASKQPTTVRPKEKPNRSSKNFETDLQSFLQDAFKESLEEKLPKDKPLPQDLGIKKRSKKPNSGLDALIRNTIEPEKISFTGRSIKQLTLTFDEKKIKKLKKIARLEKKYLRKVINDIVEEYINSYEEQKGEID